MQLVYISILFIQVATYALPTISLSISTRGDPESQNVMLDGKEYAATPLPEGYQGIGQVFKLEGGFPVDGERVPALWKRVLEAEGGDSSESKTVKEIEFMKRPSVKLHLFSQWSKTKTGKLPFQADIVIKDLREQNPPLKPFHEWHQEDKKINGPVGLRILYESLQERLLWYAEHQSLLVGDVNLKNLFFEKRVLLENVSATPGAPGYTPEGSISDTSGGSTTNSPEGSTTNSPEGTILDGGSDTSSTKGQGTIESGTFPIMPTVWRPADEDIFGIDDIAAEADQPAIMRTYKNFLGRDLEERFNMETLAKNIGVEKLRTADIMHQEFKGKDYELLSIRFEIPDIFVDKIIDGFEVSKGKTVPALMWIQDIANKEPGRPGRISLSGVPLDEEIVKGKHVKIFRDERPQS